MRARTRHAWRRARGGCADARHGGRRRHLRRHPQDQHRELPALLRLKKRAQAGSTVNAGTALSGVATVTFHGSYGRSDDAVVEVRAGSDTRIQARVPAGAITGPLSASTASGARSALSKPLAVPASPRAECRALTGSGAPSWRARPSSRPGRAVPRPTSARAAPSFSFRLSGPAPAALTVELVRASDGLAVKSWAPQGVVPGAVTSISWNGKLGRTPAAPGRYSFRLTAASADGSRATSAQTGDIQRDAFDLHDHIFPVRGRHDYGGSARFPAQALRALAPGPRRVREMASPWSPRAAAPFSTPDTRPRQLPRYRRLRQRSGLRLHAPRGAHRVPRGRPHLHRPAHRLGRRDRQRTGLPSPLRALGRPGWYDGGRPFDPLPALQAWDSWS